MKRKTLYDFNSVQLTFNQCVFNRIQYRTEHNLYSTRLDNSTDKSTDGLTIPLYNSALQFRLTNSYLQIRLTIGLTILVDQNGWNDPSVRAATLPWYKAGVSCQGLRWRTLAESDARMGRVTRGKDSFWWHFSVDRFPIMDLSPGPTTATLNIVGLFKVVNDARYFPINFGVKEAMEWNFH